jgi:hypothetical protein
MSNIDKNHTACKECIFAVYDKDTQTSCHLDIIKKIQATDHLEVLEVYDEDKEFYVINKTKCPYYRKELKNKSLEERAKEVKENIHLKYLLLINAKPDMKLEEIKKILLEIKKATIKPKGILLIIYSESLSGHANKEYLQIIRDANVGCEWRITKVVDEKTPFVHTLHHQANMMADKNMVILSVDGDYTKMVDMVEMANDLVFNQFKTFHLISNESKETLLFSSVIYRSAIQHGVDILASTNIIV